MRSLSEYKDHSASCPNSSINYQKPDIHLLFIYLDTEAAYDKSQEVVRLMSFPKPTYVS